jgi:hypothetical protein
VSFEIDNVLTRRLRRPRSRPPGETDQEAAEPLAVLHAELVLLREENARLRGAQHQREEIGRLLGRARALPSTAAADRDGFGDDAEQLLIDGLVIRESLLEICEEIERSMVAFGARLAALAAPAADHAAPATSEPFSNGHGLGAA